MESFVKDFRDFFEALNGVFNESIENEKKDVRNDNAKTSSYFHSLSEEYSNGKLVEKHEKEYKDGKKVKDENFSLGLDAKNEGAQCDGKKVDTNEKPFNSQMKQPSSEYEKLTAENDSLKSENDKLNKELNCLYKEVNQLKNKMDELKKGTSVFVDAFKNLSDVLKK